MLQKIGFLPGFNKQLTPTGAEAQWTGGENVRFRYGTPEKIGGWQQLGDKSLTGSARAVHHMVNNDGIKYAAIGTNRILYTYSGGVYYDIHPIKTDFGALTDKLASTSGSAVLTITLSTTAGMTAGDILYLENVTPPTGSGYSASDFDDKTFMITEVVDDTSVTITMGSTASATATDGDCSVKWYYPVGPAEQVGVYGWGISQFGGTVSAPQTNTLNGALGDNVYGTGGSGTSIVLDSVTGFPTTGTNYIQVGSEEISYTGVSGSTTLTGITRAVRGTTRAAHSDGATVTNTSDYAAWGQAASTTDKVAEPGLWSLDNLGSTLVALIVNGAVFEWDANATNATATRATIVSGAPTASRDMIVSTPDRHLVLFGTETTIGDTSTQDDMFIRFSSQEDINTWAPTATNSAGTQRLAAGSRIMGAKLGKSAIYVWTDTSLFTMRFVGTPFTFAYEQVGTNCGLIGKNAAVEVDGAAYWMSENGFFRFTGKLESMDCLVEDYVFDDLNKTSNQMIYCGLNNLFGEVMWFYPNSGSNVNNRCVIYSYLDSTINRPIWYTNASSIFPRTTWIDSAIFGLPHATYYDADTDTCDTVGNTDGISIYYEHETGVNQIKGGTTSAIAANILSGDFDITQDQKQGITFRGDGEFIMRVSRFLPDFLTQSGNTIVELDLRNFPNQTAASSSLGPFTITSDTNYQSCRARGRSVAVKISNTAVDSNWKMGTFRLDVHSGGRR
jgi:hypothetical protein